MHSFWLVDAVTQAAHPDATWARAALLLIQATGYMGLAILLFQGRDLG
jgi:hypothetical protein